MRIHEWLKVLAERRGSDLYLATGAPPCAKFEGELKTKAPICQCAQQCLLSAALKAPRSAPRPLILRFAVGTRRRSEPQLRASESVPNDHRP